MATADASSPQIHALYLPDFPLDTESVGPLPLAVFTTTTSRMAITFLLTPVTRSTGPTTSAPLHQITAMCRACPQPVTDMLCWQSIRVLEVRSTAFSLRSRSTQQPLCCPVTTSTYRLAVHRIILHTRTPSPPRHGRLRRLPSSPPVQ
jgi:hypothetical protein